MGDEINEAEPSPASAGSHGEPDAWAAVGQDGRLLWAERRREMVARYVVDGTPIVPLYRQPQPTLTDEERTAIEDAVSDADETAEDEELAATTWAASVDAAAMAAVRFHRAMSAAYQEQADVLRGLLERTK